jgi:hypothetical protein
MKNAYLETAKIFGAGAYINHLERKPGMDDLLLVLLEELAKEQIQAVLDAWLKGYDIARNEQKKKMC